MTEKTLILEGLPVDLDKIRSKLDLYFKNKRRSGGEVLQIQDYPGDKKKALLVYLEDACNYTNILKSKYLHTVNLDTKSDCE